MMPPSAISHAAPAHGFPASCGGPELALERPLPRLLTPQTWRHVRLTVDVLVLYLASAAALLAAPGSGAATSRWLAAIFPLVCLVILSRRRAPAERLLNSMFDTAVHALGTVSLAAVATIAAGSIIGAEHAVAMPLYLWLFVAVALTFARVTLLALRRQALRNPELAMPTLIVGTGAVGDHLARRLASDARYGLYPVGFLDSDRPAPSGFSREPLAPLLGGPDDLLEAVRRTNAKRVILAFSSQPDHELLESVKRCQELGVEVSLVPRLFEAVNHHATLDHVGGLPVLTLQPPNPRSWQFAAKHAIDRGLALLALVALAPVMAAIAMTVRLTSPGPVLFRQRRVGRDGRVFDLLKFRTMRGLASTARHYMPPPGRAPGGIEGEDRRTPIGKWLRGSSLDELPQLLNVLRGDMSLVGPRPERPEYAERFAAEVECY
jgi:lipopolysaccharide/colanic/teichoic acid biosynthesis glycosyltransferase